MIIRTESVEDYEDVYKLNYLAFQNRDDESKLIERIRLSDGFVPGLSIVAVENGDIVGHILFSKAKIIDNDIEHEAIVLAPVAVKPDYQKRGIGRRLIEAGLKRCKEQGYDLVLLIGHPEYYPKFNFKPARYHGLELTQFKVPDDVFMVHELRTGALLDINGELIYPDAFFQNNK
jgi:putative acetyltransferase